MSEMNRQQICAALGVSESTVRRLEHAGLPFTPVGVRSKRYNLDECKQWLRDNYSAAPPQRIAVSASGSWSSGKEFIESCKGMRLRVMPSEK